MEESKQIAFLEQENSRLKNENELLYKTVDQMRQSLNLLMERYVLRREEH